MPRRHQIPADVLAGPHQIPRRFLLDAGHRDRDDLAQVQQPGQMPGVAHVGLDPIPGRALQLRRRRDLALDPLAGQVPGQPEPGRAGLIGDRDRARQLNRPGFVEAPDLGNEDGVMPKEQSPGKPTTRRYSEEEKAAAVRMVRTLRAELGTEHGTVQRVADQLGYGVESVRLWVQAGRHRRRPRRRA